MADVKSRTEDWKALPWKHIQREVFRLQRRIYQAERRGAIKSTADGAYDKGPRTEEPFNGKLLRAVREWRWGGRPPQRP